MAIARSAAFGVYRAFCATFRWSGIGQVWPFENIHLSLLSQLRPDEVHLNGLRLRLDPTDNCHLSYGPSIHSFETAFLRSQIKSGDVVLDVGANIGYYTLLFAQCAGPSGHVFAFEPEPGNFALLTENVRLNGFHQVTASQKAVSDSSRREKLYLSATHGGTHRVYQSSACRNSVDCDCMCLDDLLNDLPGKVDLIKIDVEGAELSVIRGMRKLLERNPDARIFTEYTPHFFCEQGITPADYPQMLIDLGFVLYDIDSNDKRVEAADVDSLLSKYPSQARRGTNLWCVRGDSAGHESTPASGRGCQS